MSERVKLLLAAANALEAVAAENERLRAVLGMIADTDNWPTTKKYPHGVRACHWMHLAAELSQQARKALQEPTT